MGSANAPTELQQVSFQLHQQRDFGAVPRMQIRPHPTAGRRARSVAHPISRDFTSHFPGSTWPYRIDPEILRVQRIVARARRILPQGAHGKVRWARLRFGSSPYKEQRTEDASSCRPFPQTATISLPCSAAAMRPLESAVGFHRSSPTLSIPSGVATSNDARLLVSSKESHSIATALPVREKTRIA